MSFFSQFPKVSYDFNRSGTIQQMVNIFRSVRSRTTLLNRSTLYKSYVIQDGMRPDIVSEKLYGTPDYYWTFFIINDFLHDGLQSWPMSELALQEYMTKHYSGKAMIFTPGAVLEANGERYTSNSIAGKLELGALVYGVKSGAIGRIKRKDIDLNLIVVENIVNGVEGKNPQTGQTDTFIEGGAFQEKEYIQSVYTDEAGIKVELSTDDFNSLSPDIIYDYAEAPSFYYIDGDIEKRAVTSPTGISSEASQTTPVYSEVQWSSELQGQLTNPPYDPTLLNQTNLSNDDLVIHTNTSSVKPLIYSGGYQITADDSPTAQIVFQSNREHIIAQNEKHSYIRVINPNSITEFVEEFENLINA